MENWMWIAVVAAVVLVVFALVFAVSRARGRARTERLRETFGPEYERTAEDLGNRRSAEAELEARIERRAGFETRPLDEEREAAYRATWQEIQARFVEAPSAAVGLGKRPRRRRDARARLSDRGLRPARGRHLRRPSGRGRELPSSPRDRRADGSGPDRNGGSPKGHGAYRRPAGRAPRRRARHRRVTRAGTRSRRATRAGARSRSAPSISSVP